jgi:hydrogenase/urease accessory protein HupE
VEERIPDPDRDVAVIRAALFALGVLLGASLPGSAHEVRPAYLEIVERAPETYDVVFKVPAIGDDLRLGLHLRLPDGVEIVEPPRGAFTGRAHVERSRIRRAGGLDGTKIALDGLAATLTDVLVRVERSDGSVQTLRLTPDAPSFTIAAAAGAASVVRTYLALGVEHILFGFDHLLFVLALLILVRSARLLLWTITAFTLAHSVTLAAATLGIVAVPPPPVEAVIALSIVFVAGEIVHARRGRPGLSARRPWLVALAFGLLHGLGFAGALHEIGLPERQIPMALLAFNLGVEVGQIVFVGAVLALAAALVRLRVPVPRVWREAAAYGIGAVASYWLIERLAAF